MLKNFLKSAKFHFLNYVLNFKVTQQLNLLILNKFNDNKF